MLLDHPTTIYTSILDLIMIFSNLGGKNDTKMNRNTAAYYIMIK